jgi:hypothetical protein
VKKLTGMDVKNLLSKITNKISTIFTPQPPKGGQTIQVLGPNK